MKIIISIPLMNCDLARGEQHKDSCYFYSINNHDRRQEPVMYEYLEEERVPDLESILADFMTYQASSKGSCYGMQQQGTQFQRNQSSTGYHWESCWLPDYDDKAEGVINLDDLLMQFKDAVESMQHAFRRIATQISKLVDDMANTEARQEEERVEIETYQESIFQVTSIHHHMTTEEETSKVSSTPEYSCSAAAGYVRGTEKGRLELTVEDQKVSFDLFEAMKHSDMGDACSEEEEVEQEIVLTTSTMKQHFPFEKELGGEIDSLVDNEECDDPKDNCVDRVVFEKLEKIRPPVKPKAELKTLPAHLKYIFLEDDETRSVIISNSLKKEEEDQLV